ncbi:GD16304 [Drosophila simulans]|uniref:GD16304 n=1 Tax=Drosophila simulans TaxID=7240 RepID=B4R4G5_DROSI|nr:GD16304 [Drosophila simulans]
MDKLRVINAKVQKHLEGGYETRRQRYDKQACTLHARPGQEVFWRNFELSDLRAKVPESEGGQGRWE